MTDDFEERAHAAGRRVNDEAAALAGQRRDRRPGSVTSHRSRWLALAAAMLLVAGTASLVLVASNRDAQAPANTASTTNASPPPNASTSTPESTTAVADITTTIAPVAVPEDLPLVAFAESACRAQSIEWTERDGPFIWKAFARGIPEGAPVQVIADPSEGAAGPFAVVLRDYEPTRTAGTAEATEEAREIDGNQVFISVYDALDGSGDIGNGQAVWNLPDGSQAYLRSRGLDSDDIESIVANLRPRPSDHPIPGFDYDTSETQPARLTLVAEQSTDTLSSARYSITCRATNGLDVRVAIVADEGVGPYALAIDRPRPAWIVRADGAIYIGGIEAPNADGSPDPPAEALTTISPEQLTTISPEQWQQLRQQPDVGLQIHTGGETTSPSQPADPSVSPPPPRTFIDEQGLRCVEYETSTTSRAVSGVCFDDSHDDLGIRTVEAGDHYPKATIIGGTDNADAVRVIIASGGTEQAVSLTVVEGWPERIFAADLPTGAVEVRLEADDGHVLSSTST